MRAEKTVKTALIVIVLAVLGVYFASKVTRFHHQGYQSDLFCHLEMTRGWLQGRPLLQENRFGLHGKLHNYFLDLVMGPFVLLWGVYGVFIVQILLYAISFFYSFSTLTNKDKSPYFIHTVFFYLVFFVGPLSYYVYDNPVYGFHAEVLYVPIGLIFAVALARRNLWVAGLSCLAIALTKEDGAIVAACIHMLYGVWTWQSGEKNFRQWLRYTLPRLFFWVLVFLAGLWWLNEQNRGGGSRLDAVLQTAASSPLHDLFSYSLRILTQFGMLIAPMFIGLLWLRRIKLSLAMGVLLLPIVFVGLFSGLAYYPATNFSINWVPRFALVISLFLAGMFFVIMSNPKPWVMSKPLQVCLGLILGFAMFKWQISILKGQVDYSWRKRAISVFQEDDPANARNDYAQLKRLAEVLPDGYPIAPPFENFGYFHRADIIWMDFVPNAFRKPRMIVVNQYIRSYLPSLDFMQSPESLTADGLWIYFEKEDGVYLERAGIKSVSLPVDPNH
jgi:hypothetical protein